MVQLWSEGIGGSSGEEIAVAEMHDLVATLSADLCIFERDPCEAKCLRCSGTYMIMPQR